MKLKKELVIKLFIVIIGIISVSDLLIRPGHPMSFDGHVHMTTMNQFAQSMRDGEFPVTWSNNFANYGLPLPLFAHQVPAYLGALLIILGMSTETAYITLLTVSIILSSLLFYEFFRKYTDEAVSFTATVLATFFPYRALNIYTRGGLPEIMSAMFLPLLFLGVWNLKNKYYSKATILLFFSTLGIALTHPMMLLVFFIPLSIYFVFGLNRKTWKKQVLLAGSSISLGIITASYYLIPLIFEMKYFYQSLLTNEIKLDRFLSIKQLYDPTWFYTLTHPGPRGNYIKLGLLEFVILISAIFTIVFSKTSILKKYVDTKYKKQIFTWLLMTAISIALMLPIAIWLYSLPIFNKIQYPWRFLNVLQFLIPGLFVFMTLLILKLRNKIFLLSLIFLVLWFRLPEFYGKNYIVQPEHDYEFNRANLHSVNMNTVWSGNSEDYPIKDAWAEIIEGDGEIEFLELKNANRKYRIDAKTPVRMVDYTFYFSGWGVFLDNKPISFEFQDPSYRGIITYKVPLGIHEVEVSYQPTQIRTIGNSITISSLLVSICFLIYIKKKFTLT